MSVAVSSLAVRGRNSGFFPVMGAIAQFLLAAVRWSHWWLGIAPGLFK